MIRTKMLAVLVGMIATLAVSAVPAFAEFQSNSAATKGTVKTGAIVLAGGGATLECSSGSGTWTILSGGVASTKGKNEQLEISAAGCKAKSSFIKEAPGTASVCVLELTQELGKETAVGSIVKECKVEVKVLGTCVITTEGGQTGLVENKLANVGSNDVITANDGGIKSKPNSNCLGVKATEAATEKAVATAEGQKWV